MRKVSFFMLCICLVIALMLAGCDGNIGGVTDTPTVTVTNAPQAEIKKHGFYDSVTADLDGDGTDEVFQLIQQPESELGLRISVTGQNGNIYKNVAFGSDGAMYSYRLGDLQCFVFDTDLASEDGVIYIAGYKNQEIQVQELYGFIADVQTDILRVATDQYIFGTWRAEMRYAFSIDNGAVQTETLYDIQQDRTLTTKVELPAYKQAGEKWEKTTVAAGTVVRPTQTDGKSLFYFLVEGDDTPMYFETIFDPEEYSFSINGIEEFEAFSGIEYYG